MTVTCLHGTLANAATTRKAEHREAFRVCMSCAAVNARSIFTAKGEMHREAFRVCTQREEIMAKRTDIKKILIIGSGPIVIGQAAEFDYAGTQACLSLKEEGYEVILVNSNPATIMTDRAIADKIYMEPLTLEYVAKILRYERPDAILPGIGGQTGLNLAMHLEKKGVLRE